jgi:hypothetical protein
MLTVLGGLAGLVFGPAASAQCTTSSGVLGTTTVNCSGHVDVLHTDPAGTTAGVIGGQPYIGHQAVPGVTTGLLGGAPYTLQNGLAPSPPRLVLRPPPSVAPPPPTGVAAPSLPGLNGTPIGAPPPSLFR